MAIVALRPVDEGEVLRPICERGGLAGTCPPRHCDQHYHGTPWTPIPLAASRSAPVSGSTRRRRQNELGRAFLAVWRRVET